MTPNDSISEQTDVSIVVPVFNEEGNLKSLHKEIIDVIVKQQINCEIIYVDDGSTDRSAELLEAIVENHDLPNIAITIIHFTRNFGQTAAMSAGFHHASGKIVIPLDADLQNDPSDIPRLLEKYHDGYDVVSGWRKNRKDGNLLRKIPSKIANVIIGRVSGVRLHDYGCTLKAYNASMLKSLTLYGDMHRFIPLFLAARGARVTELEVNHRPRTQGESKYGLGRIVRVFSDIVLIRFVVAYYVRPMHFFGRIASVFLGIALIMFGLMLTFKFGWLSLVGIEYTASFVQTPLPIMAVAFILSAMASFFFGILAEILVRIHHEATGKQIYEVKSRVCTED